MILNVSYMTISVMALWYLNLTSTLLSRSNSQDNYFTIEKNYVVTKKTFKKFFKKVIFFLLFIREISGMNEAFCL